MRCHKSSSKRKVYSDIHLHLKKEKALLNDLTLHLKELEKEEQIKPKVSRKKEIIKIRVGIHELESRKTIKILIMQSCF